MASVLSLRPQSPFKRSFSDNPYLRSCSPLKDKALGALQDIAPRNASACSLYSLGPLRSRDWFRSGENTPPLTSRSLLELGQEKDVRVLEHPPRKRSCKDDRQSPSIRVTEPPCEPHSRKRKEHDTSDDLPPNTHHAEDAMVIDTEEDHQEAAIYDLYDAIHVPLPEGRGSDNTGDEPIVELDELVVPESSPPTFRRWMSTLRKRHMHRRRASASMLPPWTIDVMDVDASVPSSLPYDSELPRRKSESMSSSLDYVTKMKSASITVASASIAPRSEGAGLNSMTRYDKRSSILSEHRKSTDSNPGALGPIMDEGAWLRSMQRRKIIEEIISSEESYIGDLKVLINDYFMILTSVPTLSTQTRTSIQHNIAQILQLHQDLLADLHRAVPHAEFTQGAQHHEPYPVARAKHVRFHSADMIPGRHAEHRVAQRLRHSLELGRTPERRPRTLATDTETAGSIAKVFNKHMKRFFTYEEYGAHWTTMSQDLTNTCKGLQGWGEYERGVEALSKLVASENNREASSRKALAFSDLLIKPIQRVCKYPLLFEDLCRHTPVYDDPESHAELEKALFRFQETIREVNKAKDDPKTRRLIEISWQLQDRLAFEQHSLSRALVFRLLGHVLVCGVLHVAYHTPERIKGQYLVCVLYKSCLVLATTNRLFAPYNVVASIGLANATIEEADNGRGLQCHTAPHTWKLVFEHGHRLHEVILSACSSQEEEIWKKKIRERIVCETHDFVEGQSHVQDMFSSLALDIKSIGPVFGHADSLVRRLSVHRAATLGSKTNMTQVIIKNTQAQKTPEPPPPFATNSVTRSQSHMSTNHAPTLAPRRAERIRLETALEDVWTKDILPFPGMGNRKVENHIRASANSVMRKLSMASIASNFSRRSPSFSSLSTTHRSDESFGSRVQKMSQGNMRPRSATDRRPAPAIVDFHNAPAAFLPTDFELQEARPAGRRRRLANRAAGTERWTAERSIEKGTPSKPKRVRRLSAQLINLPRIDASVRLDARTASSSTTVVQVPHSTDSATKLLENEKHKGNKKLRDSTSTTASTSTGGPPPHKKSLKSKTKIFKFWT